MQIRLVQPHAYLCFRDQQVIVKAQPSLDSLVWQHGILQVLLDIQDGQAPDLV